jgi:hypothetical protein
MNAQCRRYVRFFVTIAGALGLAVALPSTKARTLNLLYPPGRTIRGEVVLKPHAKPFTGAHLIVSVEDVTAKDVAARYLARKTFKDISHDGRQDTRLRFTLEGLEPRPNHRYQVRILVDLDHNGRISRGDYRSIRPAVVFTGKDPDPLVIEAEFKGE